VPEQYNQQTWTDGLGGGTPLSAARFNAMEVGIELADDRLNALEPNTQTITYAATITPNAAAGNVHECIATGDVTLNDPNGASADQTVIVRIQASGGDRVLSFAGATADPVTIPSGKWWIGQLRRVGSTATWVLTD
jgi:hypothetical protein